MKKLLLAFLLLPGHLFSQQNRAQITRINFGELVMYDDGMTLRKDDAGELGICGDSLSISGPVMVNLDHPTRKAGRHITILARHVSFSGGTAVYSADIMNYNDDTRTAELKGHVSETENGSSKKTGDIELVFNNNGTVNKMHKSN